MLRILGSSKQLCDGVTRRDMLRVGGLGLAGTGWDTHWNHYPRMRNELCPGFDMGWYGLITDVDQRGLLDETLVVCTSEHGRTPKLNSQKGGGRDHWSQVYTSLIAGAGITRGHIVGASDKHGSDVADRPISPKDLLATMYHLLGIDPHLTIADRTSRPLPLVDGQLIVGALA
jgi:arylsulfatase A-like enzyme